MTYLTQIKLDLAAIAKLGVHDSYAWHQRVWQCFPDRDRQRRDFLTRLDQKGDKVQLTIVSAVQPTRPPWCLPDSWRGPKPISEDFFKYSRYRFQLCANPTKKVAVQNDDGTFKKNGRRVPLRTRKELLAWIKGKGERAGFAVDESTLRTIPRGREYFWKGSRHGLHSAVEFQGMLTVTDSTAFYQGFTHGIGSAKAFGFGLLVVAPVF